MTQQLAVRADVTPAQFDQDIEAAQHKAKSLKHIVDSQGLSIRIGNSEHLKVEAWLTIAAGYGFSPRIAWSRPLPDGGYEAHAELVDSMGTVIGAGEAECGTAGDDNWLGKPAFQQRSMAQTRATVRACRNKLAWVVILAGYSPTPAEEMVEGQKPMQDNRYQCPVHKTQWFKKGKMRDYAHPIGDTGEWCNMKDASLDITTDAQDVAPVTQGEASEAKPLVTTDEVVAWAKVLGYADKKAMAAVPGVTEAMKAGNFAEAIKLLTEAKK